jgi:FlaA1/EpsC-like NDP-sugar epimerase
MIKYGVPMSFEFEHDTIVIMGGTGSLGNALTERLLLQDYDIDKIIIFSRDEFKQHEMRLKFMNMKTSTDEVIYSNFTRKVEFRIGDIRDYASVSSVLKNADIVFNTSAIKQVPVAEYNPLEAIRTNTLGMANIIRAISEQDLLIHTVMGISTDKACMPINAYGMTKALMERLVIAANIDNPDTRFILTRYGNVMASRGSVIPVFANQIKNNRDVTVTDIDMTRFMMDLHEAVDTILDTYAYANPGEIYIPQILSSKVSDVAKVMIGNRNINIKITGIRPGEKLHESLVSDIEMRRTYRKLIDINNYYVITPELPELLEESYDFVTNKLNYTSQENNLSLLETQMLLSSNGLLP